MWTWPGSAASNKVPLLSQVQGASATRRGLLVPVRSRKPRAVNALRARFRLCEYLHACFWRTPVQRSLASASRLRHQFVLNPALEGVLRIWRVAHAGIDPGAVVHHAARVAERLKTPSAVVLAHSGVAHAAERQFGHQRLNCTVVDHRVARFGRV